MRHATFGNEKGITLTEMLVAIGIMAVLAGMLLPAINAARQAMFKTQCASRMKELSFAINAYAVDYRGYYPYLNNNDPENATNGFRAKFGTYIGTKKDEIFKCTRPMSDAPTGSYYYYYDLYNNAYDGGGPGTNPTIIYQNAPQAPPTARGDKGTGAIPVFMCRSSASHYPHNHGVNVVYSDGHVAWERKDWP